MSSKNSVTVYQNGIAAFERTVDILASEKTTRLNLPLKTEHLGDFLNTLRILGDGVKLCEPPTYAPEKQKPALTVNPSSVTKDLFKGLSGAAISLSLHNSTFKGTVLGTEVETSTSANGTKTEDLYVSVMSEDGQLRRFNFRTDITGYAFTDEVVRGDIQKALAYNLEQTKPGNTFVGLGLSASKAATAYLRYAIPTAAWKLTYRLSGQTLEGLAVVDNPTDEDWKDFTVTVATGTPVTFGTDLAQVRLPNRSNVNLVSENAVGAVEVNSLECFAAPAMAGCAPKGTSNFKAQRMSAVCDSGGTASYSANIGSAETAQAEITDVGAFSVFRSELPMTIPSRKSGLVPLFTQKLGKSEAILYCAPDSTNLMRAMKLENDTTFTFGRGSCSVEENGVHVGSAVLSLTKPGQSALLCHAVESGVKLTVKNGPISEEATRVNLADGVLLTEKKFVQSTMYTIKPTNTYDGPSTLVIDYNPKLHNGEVSVYPGDASAKVIEKLPNGGVRIQCKIEEDAGSTFSVVEMKMDKRSIKAEGVADWLVTNPTCPLLTDDKLSKFRTLAEELSGINITLGAKKALLTQLANTQDRVRKNLDAMKGDSTDFKTKLMKSEADLSAIEGELPKLEERKAAIIHLMRANVATAAAEWVAKPSTVSKK